jgi:hypothetical protein
MSFSPLSYLAGIATIPVALIVVFGIVCAAETGKEIECGACGYSTGPMQETERITCWTRWFWHRTAHRLGVAR